MSVRLSTGAPFHLEATVRVLQRRPTNRVDVWEQDRYLRLLATPDGLALIGVENRGTIDEPDLRCAIRYGDLRAGAQTAVERTVRKVLGLDVDPAPLQRLIEGERALRAAARALRGMRPPRFPGLFEAFASVVPFQQVSLDAGAAISGRLIERFGRHIEHGGRRFHAFPTPGTIAGTRVARLRECGLSVRKGETLRRLARAIAAGELNEETLAGMSTGEALRALTALPGIGPWSAGLVLLRGFGRLDVFPPGDAGARRSLGALMHLAPDAPVERIAERFGEQRGYVYFYGLGSSLLAKGLIHPAPA